MNTNTLRFTMKTRLDKNAKDATSTDCVLHLGQEVSEDIATLVEHSARIRLQMRFRADGIPPKWEGSVDELTCRKARTPATPTATATKAVGQMSMAELAEFIAQAQKLLASA